jgi:hypothetical protein
MTPSGSIALHLSFWIIAMEDRRRTARQRSFLGGLIRFNAGYSSMNCVVANISLDGAKLRFGSSVMLPPHFVIEVDHLGLKTQAQVVWRDEESIGVAFLRKHGSEARALRLFHQSLADHPDPPEPTHESVA